MQIKRYALRSSWFKKEEEKNAVKNKRPGMIWLFGGKAVSAVKHHWGLTRPDVTTTLVRLTNTDLPSAGFCFTTALFHPHISPNEIRWSFPICCSLLAWHKQKSRRQNYSLTTSKETRFGFISGGRNEIIILECCCYCWTCIQTHTTKKISILFPSSSSSTDKHTAVKPLCSQHAQCSQPVLFWEHAENRHTQPTLSNFSQLPALPDNVSMRSVASLASLCRCVPLRLQLRAAGSQDRRLRDTRCDISTPLLLPVCRKTTPEPEERAASRQNKTALLRSQFFIYVF